jgi:hypothetical protein
MCGTVLLNYITGSTITVRAADNRRADHFLVLRHSFMFRDVNFYWNTNCVVTLNAKVSAYINTEINSSLFVFRVIYIVILLPRYFYNKQSWEELTGPLISSIEQSYYWEINNRSAGEEILTLHGTVGLITIFTRSSHWTSPEPNTSSPFPQIMNVYLKSDLHLSPLSGLFPSVHGLKWYKKCRRVLILGRIIWRPLLWRYNRKDLYGLPIF